MLFQVGSSRIPCVRLLRLLSVVAFLGGFAAAFRLYPEQDGKYNWYSAHIGTYTGVALCARSSTSDAGSSSLPSSFVVATDDGVVARVRASDGGLVWRQVLEDGIHVNGSSVECRYGRVSVDGGAYTFDAMDGGWLGNAGAGLSDGSDGVRTRVCTDNVCVDALVAENAKEITSEELAGYVAGGLPLRAMTVVVGLDDVAIIQFACGTTVAFDRRTMKSIWKRYEYLSSIDKAFFVDLPPSTPALEEAWRQTQPSRSRSLFVQLLILKTQLGMGTPRDVAIIDAHKAMTSNLLRPTRDLDGFRQQIVVSSARAGKVASLHSGDGRVLWDADVGPGDVDRLVVAPWSVSDTACVLVAFVSGHREEDGDLRVLLLDGFTGKVLKEDAVTGSKLTVVPVGTYEKGERTQHAFAVLQDGLTRNSKIVAVLPEEASKDRTVAASLRMLVRWDVTEDKTSVTGRTLGDTGGVEVWRVNVDGTSNMKILEIAERDVEEKMYSVAKPMFGGGVLIKSVNPNAILVIAGDGAREILEVNVIDAYTGRVIVSQEVQHARGPVKGIVSENWVAYHYWNTLQSRWTIGVIDLYHPQPDDLTAQALFTGTYGANSTASPYEQPAKLLVESESYRIKYPASCMAVTKTAHGTAAKMLLLGTPAGQVIAIDRRMLDPRRPKLTPGAKPTPEQVFERLPSFHPELGIGGPSFVTLYHRVERLKGVTTSATVLESSSLVFANGLDTYFMRMMPSRGFDVVPPDFPRALLVTMVLGLGLALGLLRRVVKQRTLNLSWG